MMPSRAAARPVSAAVVPVQQQQQQPHPQYHAHHANAHAQAQLQLHQEHDQQQHRDRSGSGSIEYMGSSGGGIPPPAPPAATVNAGVSPRPRQTSNADANASSVAPPQQQTPHRFNSTFQPVQMDQVMASASGNVQRALTDLLRNYNTLLQEREQDRHERTRLNTENSKLWSMCSSLKKERETLQREMHSSSGGSSSTSSTAAEVRYLASRVAELEGVIVQSGLSLPAPVRGDDRSGAGGGGVESTRRPAPSPRSVSDNGALPCSSTAATASSSRERQRSTQANDVERVATSLRQQRTGTADSASTERTGMMSSSNSSASFATASSDPLQLRDTERERRRAGAGTPPIGSGTPHPNTYSSPPVAGSRARDGAFSPSMTSSSSMQTMPPLSNSASTSTLSTYHPSLSGAESSSSLPILQPRDKAGLATIPSTPIINDGAGAEDGHSQEGVFPSSSANSYETNLTPSPVSGQFSQQSAGSASSSRRGARSDAASTEHLRIAAAAHGTSHPTSPAMSTSSSSHSHSQRASPSMQQHSPRSPFLPTGEPSPSFAQPPRAHQPPPLSSSALPSAANANSRRTVSRKASSLDLARPDKQSPLLPSRAVTPPPDLGSPKQPGSPDQYATVLPRTPPRGTSLDETRLGGTPSGTGLANGSGRAGIGSGDRSLHGTPMMELPDEARRYIMAANGGLSMPSPISPFNPASGGPNRGHDQRLGGLGIISGVPSEADRLSAPDSIARPRRASSALQAVAAQASQIIQQPSNGRSGRLSPLERGIQQFAIRDESQHQSPAERGILQQQPQQQSAPATGLQGAYDERQYPAPASPTRTRRPNNERAGSDRQERPRAYTTTEQPPQAGLHQHAPMPGYHASAPPPLQQPPSRLPSAQRSRDDYGHPQAGAASSHPIHQTSLSGSGGSRTQQQQPTHAPAKCVALVPSLLSAVVTEVVASNIKIVDRGREVVIFHVRVSVKASSIPSGDPRGGLIPSGVPKVWIVEKSWNDTQVLDAAIRAKNPKSNVRKLPGLPDKHLFKDHAPSKVDQRKKDLQKYLAALCDATMLPERSELCVFLTTNIVSDRSAPVSNPGYKAGYLTKKGRNFGGWTTRYYVLQGRMLEYYDTPGGQHLGSIDIKDANIGRQNTKQTGGDDSIRHAFLIRAKDKTGEETDHILCAESDEERDVWVNMLVCCLTGEYVPDTIAAIPTHAATGASVSRSDSHAGGTGGTEQRPPNHAERLRQQQYQQSARKSSKEAESGRGSAQSNPQGPPDSRNQKVFTGPVYGEPARMADAREQQHRREQSAGQSSVASGVTDDLPAAGQRGGFRRAPYGSDMPSSSSLPANLSQLADSDSHPSLQGTTGAANPHLRLANTVSASDADVSAASQPHLPPSSRPKSPEKRIKISGPSGGAPIGADFKRKVDRSNKVKSSFWGFADRRQERRDVSAAPARPVFGVPIQEAVDVARVREDSDLPAVVFRCVQYLSSVKAESEEGIYRMSGSSAVIKALKDRFNAEGDVDLTTEYYDPHAVAGLLKTFFRELPVHIFTSELNPDFIRANEIEQPKHKIREISRLVTLLPVANYSALRFLSAHLVNIVREEQTNKMNIRNMGIVFSPTLAIPATLFSLFINEFDRIFREIDEDEAAEDGETKPQVQDEHAPEQSSARQRTQSSGARRRSRNSTLFTQSGADRLLEPSSDLDVAPEEEDAYESESGADGGLYQHHNDHSRREGGGYDEETVKNRRHKLTVDVTPSDNVSYPSGDHWSQQQQGQPKSPSISSASSPRQHLYPNSPLRSPGLPASPRHAESNFPGRR